MTISITFSGDADAIRAQMARLLGDGRDARQAELKFASTAAPEKAAAPAASEPVAEVKAGKRGKGKAETPAISTGGERVDPEAPAEPTAPTAPTAPVEPVAKELTLDDVRNAAGAYIKKFTIEAAQVDLMGCLKAATGVEKISELAGKDQETLAKAVKAFTDAAAADTRYGQLA